MCPNDHRYSVIRTTSQDPAFRELVALLDMDLAARNGDNNAFFAQYNKLEHIQHVVMVAHGERPVGCGAFKPFDGDAVEMKRMFTMPGHRRQGIGSTVLHALEQWAMELGQVRRVLETGKNMTEAVALYGRHGYRLIPNYGPYIGVVDSLCFEKVL